MFRLVTTYRVVIEKEHFHAMHLFHHALHIDRNGLTHVHHEAAGDKTRIYKFRSPAKAMLGRHTDLFKRDKSAHRVANVENKATKSCYTNIRVDGQARAREGRRLRQRCKYIPPPTASFFG